MSPIMYPVLRVYKVQHGREQELRPLLLSLVTWLQQFPEVVDARAFQCRHSTLHFYSWAAWANLTARDQALQSMLWPRIMASMRPVLSEPPTVHTLEAIFSRHRETRPHGPAILAVLRCPSGAEGPGREAMVRYGQEAAKELCARRIFLGQSVEDRSTFAGLFDLFDSPPPHLPTPKEETLQPVQWCVIDPLQAPHPAGERAEGSSIEAAE